MNPLAIAQVGAGVLGGIGGFQQAQQQKRQYNLDKQAGNRADAYGFLDAYNQQQRRAGQTGTKSALLQQMAQRLGLNIPMGVSRELLLKPMSGTTRMDQQMKNYYGMGANGVPRQPARPTAAPTAERSNPNAIMQALAPYFQQMGR